jgi:hypothetical protein
MEKNINNISDQILAAFLDGKATAQESQDILASLVQDDELRELLRVSQAVDAELGHVNNEIDCLPMSAMAASCEEGAFCCMECEKYILKKFGFVVDEEAMVADAFQNGWVKEKGTALHNVGRHIEKNGLLLTRRYHATFADLSVAIERGESVIVAVDGGELIGNKVQEKMEDILAGPLPDHTVVVLEVDAQNETLIVYDPNSVNDRDEYPVNVFMDAWADSSNYMVSVAPDGMKEYDPCPIDLSDVELPDELNELREAIAENAHDVWALERKAQGWTYGAERNDERKETPCMVAYSQLPESEKTFDREMAMNTLKLLKKLGYDIVKK